MEPSKNPRAEYFRNYQREKALREKQERLKKTKKINSSIISISPYDWVQLPTDLSLDMRIEKISACEKILTVIRTLTKGEKGLWCFPSKDWMMRVTDLKSTAFRNAVDFLIKNRILQVRSVTWYERSSRGLKSAREFRLMDEISYFGTVTSYPIRRVEMILQSPFAAIFKDATKVLCMAYFISACSDGFTEKPVLKTGPIEWCEKYESGPELQEGERLNSRFSNVEYVGRDVTQIPEGPLCGRGEMPMMLELNVGGQGGSTMATGGSTGSSAQFFDVWTGGETEGGVDESIVPDIDSWFKSDPIGIMPQSVVLEDLELKSYPLNDFTPDFPTGFNDSNGGSGVDQGWPIGGLGGGAGTQGKVEQAAPKAQTGGSKGAPEAKATQKVVGFKIGDKAVAEDLQPQRSEAPYAWLGVDPPNEVQPKKDSLKAMKSALKAEVPQQQEVELEDPNDPDFSPTAHLDGLTTRLKHFADDPTTDPEWLADLNGLLDRIRKCPNLKPGANGLYPMGYRLDPRYAEDCRLLSLINQLPTKDKLKFPMVDKAVAVRLNNALFHLSSSLQKGPPKIEAENS